MDDTERKMFFMFTEIHGEYTGSFSADIVYDEYGDATGVQITNEDGYSCGFYSKFDILFDYLTRRM